MDMNQAHLFSHSAERARVNEAGRERLAVLLGENLDFHDQDSGYAAHNFHAFPARFPPQVPRRFITSLTAPGDVVLDPMVGSGTTVLESLLLGRRGIGFDIDPLALLIARVKVTPLDAQRLSKVGAELVNQAMVALRTKRDHLQTTLDRRWNASTRAFVDNWFAPETRLELLALRAEIEKLGDAEVRDFFELAFSAIIITKSGGVSLALDLAHTRPHLARVVTTRSGNVISGSDRDLDSHPHLKTLTKILRPAIEEFEKRVQQNLKGVLKPGLGGIQPLVMHANAQGLPLDDASVDLIVTSPPYASNAIDYLRAHKFSLVWSGTSISDLAQKRNEYIGGETVAGIQLEELPALTTEVVRDISERDRKKGYALHRYYSEMTRALREMFRVLRPGKAAIVVVGTSIMRGRDTETQNCLAEIGRAIGFEVPRIGVRGLDRDRRMLPAGAAVNRSSQIQQRMHEEYVIGFYKPQRYS